MIRPQIIMKIKDKIKNWYYGKRVIVPLPKDMIGLPIVYHIQPPLARFLKLIFKPFHVLFIFIIKHWQFTIGTILSAIGLYLTYLQLIKTK